MTINDTLAKNLTYYQHDMKLDNKSFAQVCGISTQTLLRIYDGNTGTTIGTLEQMADGLGCKPSDLILDWDGELERV